MNLGKGLIKIMMFAANIIVVLMMFASLLASVISPAKILLPAYITLILPLTILMNIGFICFWLLFRKWFFMLSLLTLLVCFNLVRNTFPVNFNNPTEFYKEDGFTLLTYNTNANDLMAKHTSSVPNKVIQYMFDKDPDVLCIQEYAASLNNHFLTEKDLMEIFKKYPYQHIYFKVTAENWKTGVATFSKFPIIKKSNIQYKSKFNSSIVSDIQIKGKVLRLFNNHLESNQLTQNDKIMAFRLKDNFDTENIKGATLHLSRKLGAAYRVRAPQADTIAALIANSPYPVMVVGDFNDLPSSYAYSKIRGDLKDAFVEKGFGLGWTFNESLLRFRIDHILYEPSLKLAEFKLENKVRYSDHYPLYCKIIF